MIGVVFKIKLTQAVSIAATTAAGHAVPNSFVLVLVKIDTTAFYDATIVLCTLCNFTIIIIIIIIIIITIPTPA